MSEQQSGLRFDIYERVHLPASVAAIQELDEVELTPQIRVTVEGDQAVVKGYLLLVGAYSGQAEGESRETKRLEHTIPVEITLPVNRIRSVDDITVEIDNFDIDLLSSRSLNVTGVLSLGGIEMLSGHPEAWREEEEVLFVHETAKADETFGAEPGAAAGRNEFYEPHPEAIVASEPVPKPSEPATKPSEAPLKATVPLFKASEPSLKPGEKTESLGSHFLKQYPQNVQAVEGGALKKPGEPLQGEAAEAQQQEAAETARLEELQRQAEAAEIARREQQRARFQESATERSAPKQAASDSESAAITSSAQLPVPRDQLPDDNFEDYEALNEYDGAPASTTTDDGGQEEAVEAAADEAEKGEMKIAFGSKKPEGGSAFDLKSYLSKTDDYRVKKASEPQGAPASRSGRSWRGEPGAAAAEPVAETGGSDVLEWKNLFLSANEEQQFRTLRLCIVHKDDTVESIARKYDRKPQEIRLHNSLSDTEVSEGQILYIP
ncbi:LysM peptidoglycan-binding domain-containing protein [Paenibacillus hodogayensis]|uniref:LysM peptidoglycan-binding domain-containing protein n=1 Tax=Paenibacillus hodogayensis TaxID=279208 RepID=A0ABV5VVV5_9BACL